MGKPTIRFEGYTDDWEQRKLGELGSLKNGMNFSKEAMGIGFPFVNLQNIFGNNVIDVTNLGKAMASDSQLKDYNLLNGDVLFVRSSVKLEGVGEAAVVPQNLENTTYSGFIIRFRDEYGLDNNFKRFLFGIESVRNQIMAQATNSANKNISQTVLENLCLKIPNKSEQEKIGLYFSNLDNLITLHQRKCEETKKLKKFMLQKMFPKKGEKVPEIRFDDFTDDWEQRKVPELLKNSSSAMKIGPFGSALKKEYFVEEGVKVYAQENVFTGDFSIGSYYITEDKYKELQSCELYPGDLVISMMGTIGACAIFPENMEKGIMNSHLLRLQFDNEVVPKYIMYLLRDSDLIRKQIDRLSVGSIMSGLSSSVVKKLVFPIPRLAEQKKIIEYLDSLDKIITLHQHKCEELQNIKKFMLKNMFI